MIRGKDNLLNWVKRTPGVKQIQVRTAPGADAFLFQSDTDENRKTVEDRLASTIDLLEPGKYYIEMSDGTSKRGWFRESFILDAEPSFSTTPAVGGISSEDVDRRIAEALESQRKDFEIEQLREKVKEYESECDEESPIERAIGAVAPYIPTIMQRFFGRPSVGIAGTDAPVTSDCHTEYPADDTERIMIVARRLAAIEPEYLTLLESLCDRLEANPALLTMIKSFV